MATIGTLLVELRANAAQFQAEIDRTRRATHAAGDTMALVQRKAENFAEQGLARIVPISGQAGDALVDLIGNTERGARAIQAFAKAWIVVEGALAVGKVVEEAEHWLRYGETLAGATERLREWNTEQAAFAATMSRSRTTIDALDRELATLRGDQEKILEIDARTRLQRAQQGTAAGSDDRVKAEVKALAIAREQERKMLDERARQREAADAAIIASMVKVRDAAILAQRQETEALGESLKLRLTARQAFEERLGTGGLGGGLTAGLRAAREFRQAIDEEARQLAFLEREGIATQTALVEAREGARQEAIAQAAQLRQQYAAYPEVLATIDRSLGAIEWGNFGAEVARGRDYIDQNIASVGQLQTAQAEYAAKLNDLMTTMQHAGQSVVGLANQYAILTDAIRTAGQWQAWFDAVAERSAGA